MLVSMATLGVSLLLLLILLVVLFPLGPVFSPLAGREFPPLAAAYKVQRDIILY